MSSKPGGESSRALPVKGELQSFGGIEIDWRRKKQVAKNIRFARFMFSRQKSALKDRPVEPDL
jgi:hypothetical protein